MKTVATPNRQQSQAYISVVALFQIFSTAKEDKAYLRMPSSWRELYTELIQLQSKHVEDAERKNVGDLRAIIRDVTDNDGEEDSDEDVVLTRNIRRRHEQSRSGSASPALGPAEATYPSSEQLRSLWHLKTSMPSYQRMLQHRNQLPVFAFRDHALSTIERNQVTIICGETGCGKSTQIPSYILEHELSQGKACKVYCTEPRRISAITLAQRVSEELGENKRDVGTPRSLVGYAIRLESRFTGSTRLVYATTGILLRMLETPEGTADVTHLVIDEVHERSIETDFLLIIVNTLRLRRPELRVILMSATVDATRFSSYFGGAPVLDVPGRTFPVESQFLEDAIESTGYTIGEDDQYIDEPDAEFDDDNNPGKASENAASAAATRYSTKTLTTLSKMTDSCIQYNLIVRLISFIITTRPQYARAVLVFLPGLAEIRRLSALLSNSSQTSTYVIHALHSTISSEEQQAAFQPPPRGYTGKIVLSTNIAETGVTIPDITCVIDTGKHKEMRFDERRQISRLVEVYISRANAKQRRGRAGRVQAGLCYHLFSRDRHDRLMADAQTPEILRLSLQDLIMRVKICKLGDIRETLSSALDAPLLKNIQRAIDALVEVGALSSDESLTPLGQELSKLPLDPYLGKLVLHGAQFGVLDAALTIAAILTSKSPFVTTADSGKATDNARQAFAKGDSDLITDYNAYSAWRRICTSSTSGMSEHQFCKRSMLSLATLSNIEDLKGQLYNALSDAGCLPPAPKSSTLKPNGSGPGHASEAGGHRRFLSLPQHLVTHNNDNIPLLQAVISWSFYPKVLVRDNSASRAGAGGGWRNVSTNQAVNVAPSSIFRLSSSSSDAALGSKTTLLSFYSILQTSSGARSYNANSLTPVSPLLLLLLSGSTSPLGPPTAPADGDSLSLHPLSNVLTLDVGGPGGQKLRYQVPDIEAGSSPEDAIGAAKTALCIKYMRRALGEVMQRRWKRQPLSRELEKWMEIFSEMLGTWEVKK